MDTTPEPPETGPADTVPMSETTATADQPSAPAAAEAIPVYDEEGNVVAQITVQSSEAGWTDYAEGDEPDEGNEYVRVTVFVESMTTDDDTFGVNVDDFILQSMFGYTTTAENIRTAAQADADEEPVGEADMAAGESVELTLTFQVVANAGAQSVFYRPEDDRLVDVVDVG